MSCFVIWRLRRATSRRILHRTLLVLSANLCLRYYIVLVAVCKKLSTVKFHASFIYSPNHSYEESPNGRTLTDSQTDTELRVTNYNCKPSVLAVLLHGLQYSGCVCVQARL